MAGTLQERPVEQRRPRVISTVEARGGAKAGGQEWAFPCVSLCFTYVFSPLPILFPLCFEIYLFYFIFYSLEISLGSDE